MSRDVIAMKVATEEAWAYQRRGERLSFPAMAELAALPIEQGGLGYRISAKTLRDRSDSYLAHGADHRDDRRRASSSAATRADELARFARDAIGRAALEGKVDHAAMKVLLDVQKREAALHGLDAALRIEADVTNHDALDAELDAMLARMPGRRSIGVDE